MTGDSPRTETPPDRRETLIEAAAALIAERGIAAVRTRDVTARAGVGVGLLNHYFTWSELRAAALERVLEAAEGAVLGQAAGDPPARRDAVLRAAFDPGHEALLQVWIEAEDLARGDPALADVLARAMAELRAGLAALIAEGVARGDWACPDPEGAALRLIALHDGLVGFLLTGVPPLDRGAATAHLARAFALECPGG
ncbi:TetR/AcrR family transcriptional regulator [Roseicyclus persicicus]|uniref:TetR family transcriptional regulator n=1 Tax=Roseicyclus persicicus TaxID=2650661 RepID=A0A7X6GZ90_9RHOB|nr:TetR family transcriptional regulator C-terminal domain-containing protein [Roseibacterium persicicum]NKX43852.1 TetR family transcriptional regulator [Roseibacterium persicicum]